MCTVKEERNAVTKMLEGLGFQQLVKDATHTQGGHIDHSHTEDKWIEFPWILDPFLCGILTLNEPADLK